MAKDYLFKIGPEFKRYLKDNEEVDDELRKEFARKGIHLFDNVKIYKKSDKEWDISNWDVTKAMEDKTSILNKEEYRIVGVCNELKVLKVVNSIPITEY